MRIEAKASTGLVVSVALCFGSSAIAQSPLNEGGWLLRTTTSQVAPNQSVDSLVSDRTDQVCMTREFLATNPYLNPYKNPAGRSIPDCSVADHVSSAQTASWNMTCRAGRGRSSRAIIWVSASSESMTSVTVLDVMQDEQHGSTMRVRVHGTFLGKCTPDMEIFRP